MNVLFFGDIVGSPGITVVSDFLPKLVERFHVDLVIANGENATRGFGLNYGDARLLKDAGVDVITLGNHWRSRSSIEDFFEEVEGLVRPFNIREHDEAGVGYVTLDVKGVPVTVSNILGTAFMKETVNSPLGALVDILGEVPEGVHIVDYHGESTSEKSTFAHYFDGQVAAILGTHTHVQTADARVLPHGTAFISDVGMCGAFESVIGFEPQSVIDRIIMGSEKPMQIEQDAKRCINAVLLDIDEETGLSRSIRPLFYVEGKSLHYGEENL